MLLLALAGCLDAILEAPYVLTTGLTEIHSISPTGRGTMLAATPAGIVEIDGSGRHVLLARQPARAVAAHARTLYLLTDDALLWGDLPERGGLATHLSSIPAPDVVDIQAWCNERLLLAGSSGLEIFDPAVGIISAHPTALPPLRAVSLPATAPCEGAVVVSEDAVIEVTGIQVRRHAVSSPRLATPGRDGHIWVIHGDPPVLSRLDSDGLSLRAEHIGDPRDAHFGTGGLFSPGNIYLADGSGTLDYARVIDTAP
jgi:hypothetical protein